MQRYMYMYMYAFILTTLAYSPDEVIQQHAAIVTTEVSQVPLSGVLALLNSARCV